MQIKIIKCLQDNYSYLIIDKNNNACVVDPSESKPVINYLASSIKAYAYRSFLISDGQNEKAMLQEQMALDLLVKEIDKLVHQQDRGVKGFKAIAI